MVRQMMFWFTLAVMLLSAARPAAASDPVLIGVSLETGHPTSTSDDAVRFGIRTAIHEINAKGGVLKGRKLEMIERDNRGTPARFADNVREFAKIPGLVAMFCGKFSSAVIDSLPLLHENKLPLLDPWAANDKIIDNGMSPNYAFRLSLKDSWVISAMFRHAAKRGFTKVGLLLINTSWGRNNLEFARKYVNDHPSMRISDVQMFNYGERLGDKYEQLRRSGAQTVMLFAIETESASLVKDLAALPKSRRLPVISSASIAGGDQIALAGLDALQAVDLVFVQTSNLHEIVTSKGTSVLESARAAVNIRSFGDIKSPCGFAHAYDLTHILARAIDLAGSTDREAVRNALEQVRNYDGLIMSYTRPFTPTRHDALDESRIFMARYGKDGLIRKAR